MYKSSKQKALSFLEYKATNVRADEVDSYKEKLYDSVARRILKDECTKAQIKYWADKQDEYLYLNKR